MSKVKNLNSIPVNGLRGKLADDIPLLTPYKIDIFPIYACNFKCSYCIHSMPEIIRGGNICTNKMLFLDLLKKFVEDAKHFEDKIRAIHFAGYGEPLLHPDIAHMVKLITDGGIADVVDIVTNGSLLNTKLSTELLNSGLDKLRISLQGLDSDAYKRVSDINLDFEKFKNNIREFKEMRDRGNYSTQIYIKILDSVLDRHSEKDFYEMFSPLCDYIAVEHLAPLVNEIQYEDIFDKKEFTTNVKGNKIDELKVCPWPFYSTMINPDGDVLPCCNYYKPIILGNIRNESIVDIWNSQCLKDFQKQQLLYQRNLNSVCRNCNNIKYLSFPEDNLDGDTGKILNKLM